MYRTTVNCIRGITLAQERGETHLRGGWEMKKLSTTLGMGTDEEFQPEIMKRLISSRTAILGGYATPPQTGLSDLPSFLSVYAFLICFPATWVTLRPQLHQALFDLWAFTDAFLCA